MAQPKHVTLGNSYHATFRDAAVGATPVAVPFTPVGYVSSGLPAGASAESVAVISAYRIYVSNTGSAPIRVAPVLTQLAGTQLAVYPSSSTQAPAFVDPTTFAAPSATSIVVPAGAVAFPIDVRAYGVTIDCPTGSADVSVQAYGPLTLFN